MRFLLLQACNQLGFRWESVLLTLTACFSRCFHLPGMHMCTCRDVSISFSSTWEALRGEKGIASSHSGANRSEPGLPGKRGLPVAVIKRGVSQGSDQKVPSSQRFRRGRAEPGCR